MLYEVRRRLLLGRSTVCSGYGVFAGENFQKGEFVGEYLGEIMNEK
jgi:SET domain-containing protein